MTTMQLDEAKQEAFAGRMIGLLNDAFLGILVSLGHRTGLYDTLAELAPSTSEDIATAAGLSERYVREWLGAQVTGGIVEYDAGPKTYHLPPEHAAFLTRAAGPDNFAFFAQYIALTSEAEGSVLEAFRTGRGVHPSEYAKFQELQREETARVYDAALVEVILPVAEGLPERLDRGIDVLDVGCGAGHAVNVMARAYPNSRFTGVDIAEDGIALARAEAEEWGLTNARFEARDAAALEGEYDLITAFDVVHDLAWPRDALATIARVLRPDGTFLMGDIAASSSLEGNLEHPFGPFLYSVSVLYCMSVSLAFDGEGLGTVWGEQKAGELLAEAGFTDVDVRKVEGDPLNVYYVARTA